MLEQEVLNVALVGQHSGCRGPETIEFWTAPNLLPPGVTAMAAAPHSDVVPGLHPPTTVYLLMHMAVLILVWYCATEQSELDWALNL